MGRAAGGAEVRPGGSERSDRRRGRRGDRRRERRTPVFQSLRLRMALSHGAVLAAIVVVLGGVGYALLAHNQDRQATADVTIVAAQQVDRIEEAGAASAAPDSDTPSSSATRVAVFRPDGSIVGEPTDAPRWLRPQPTQTVTKVVGGELVRLVTLRAPLPGGGSALVVAGRSLEPVDELMDRVRLLLLAGGLLAVAASMVAGWFLAGRALRPVRRAYEAQANFAADASHELRTPLAFVRSGVEVLADHDPELGEEVLSEVDYLTGLTERLLTLARADDVSLALRPVAVELLPLCRRSVERNERVHGVRVDIVENAAEPAAFAMADPVTVEAVVDAVLENVARHGGGAADLSVRRADGRVRLTLADHGPGLAVEQRAAAFDRFFRADPSRARDEGGAGLGLALARELVVAQRGRMWLEETPGGGITAVVELPAANGRAVPGESNDMD
jgi:signal transduction histidine kinase